MRVSQLNRKSTFLNIQDTESTFDIGDAIFA